MKTMGYKGMVIVLFSMFVVGVSAQSVLTLKVTNVPSAKGKLMAATDKASAAVCFIRSPAAGRRI